MVVAAVSGVLLVMRHPQETGVHLRKIGRPRNLNQLDRDQLF